MVDRLLDILAPGWVGSLIGLAGIAIAVATFIKTRSRSILAYRTRGIRILGSPAGEISQDVTVQFRGRDVPRLTRSVIVLWNEGEKTILEQDLVGTDPLRIEVGEGYTILSMKVVKSSRPVIAARCGLNGQSESHAIVQFDFLDHNDGLVVDILHTDVERHPKLKGSIRGIPSGPKYRGRVINQPPPSMRRFPFLRTGSFAVITIVLGIALMIVGLFVQGSTPDGALVRSGANYILFPAGAMYAGLGCLMLWTIRRRYPRGLHCEELE